jgi:hypothetical protein
MSAMAGRGFAVFPAGINIGSTSQKSSLNPYLHLPQGRNRTHPLLFKSFEHSKLLTLPLIAIGGEGGVKLTNQ